MNQPSLFEAAGLQFNESPPAMPKVAEARARADVRLVGPPPPEPPPMGKRKGYQISAKPESGPSDPGTCTYTEALDEEGALTRAQREFPPEEGWVDHEAREIPGAC